MACALNDDRRAPCPCTGSYTKRRRCEYWLPSRTNKYSRCRLFLETRTLCPLEVPKCDTCPHHIVPKKSPLPANVLEGRVADHRDYMRHYMRRKRAMERVESLSVEVIGPDHPDYPKPASETP